MTTRQVAFRLKSEGKTEVLRDAGEVKTALAGAYDAAAASAVKATEAADRQERRFRAMAQAARESEAQSRNQAAINSFIGVGDGSGKSARDSAALFEEQAVAMERAEARAARLKAILDPVGTAQDHLNDELRENIELQRQGYLTTEQLAKAQQMAKARFDETTLAIERQSKGLSRQAVQGRLNLARQGADVFTTAAMGMSPGMIAIQQGPQILDALATSGFKASTSLIALGGAVTVVAGGVAALGAAWLHGEDISLQYEKAVTGIGRTAGLTASELEGLTIKAAEAGDVSEKTARSQAAAYLATGRIGGDVLGGLIRIGKDYASVMGMDAEDATKSLAKAMTEPDKAGRELTRTMGLLDQAQLKQIDSLVKAGDLLGAQTILLKALDGAVEGHAEKAGLITSAWDAIGRSISNAVDQLGRFLYQDEGERLQQIINRRASIERAANGRPLDARAQGVYNTLGRDGQAILNARAAREAQDKARADEAKRNRDAQLAEDGRLAALRGRHGPDPEVAARREARELLQRTRREEDAKADQAMRVAQALGDTDEIRRLEQQNALRERTRQLIDDKVKAEDAGARAQAEQAAYLAAAAIQTEREAEALRRSNTLEVARIVGDERRVELAEKYEDLLSRIAAYQSAGEQYYSAWLHASQDQLKVDEARAKVVRQITEDAEAERRLTLARLSGDTGEERRLSQEARIAQRAREIESRGRADGTRMNRGDGDDQAMSEIQAELDAEARGVRRAWIKDFIGDIRQGGIAEALGHQFESAADRLVDKLIDQLFEIDWGKIFASSGSSGGGIGGLISRGVSFLFGHNASGTDYWEGGPTWVGERCPELLNLPRGSKVTEHDRSMRTAFAAPAPAAGHSFSWTIDARGAGPNEIDRLEAKMDALAQSIPGMIPGVVNDGIQRRLIRTS